MFWFNKILFLFAVIPPGGPAPGATIDFLGYAQFLYPFALSVAAILAVIMLVIAGLEMMTASEGLREDAKKKIWGAVLGLLLAVGSFLILNTINPQLINLKLTLPSVTAPGGQQPAQPGTTPPGGCITDAQCGAGNICVGAIPGRRPGTCQPQTSSFPAPTSCVTNADCGAGRTCVGAIPGRRPGTCQ